VTRQKKHLTEQRAEIRDYKQTPWKNYMSVWSAWRLVIRQERQKQDE